MKNIKFLNLCHILAASLYMDLFWEFFKIGLFAVGGGFATIPFLYNLTHHFNWLTVQDVSDIIAVATVLPGPVGVSSATFMGWKIAGIPGGLTAALGLIAPSFIVIIIVAKLFMQIKDNKYVINIFYGLRPVVCGLIAACGYTFLFKGITAEGVFHWKPLVLFLLTVSCMLFVKKIKIHPVAYILAGAVIGIIFKF